MTAVQAGMVHLTIYPVKPSRIQCLVQCQTAVLDANVAQDDVHDEQDTDENKTKALLLLDLSRIVVGRHAVSQHSRIHCRGNHMDLMGGDAPPVHTSVIEMG